jgi:hypothetical protein
MIEAIADEKRLKKYRRQWKINLIEAMNPDWLDLYLTLNGGGLGMDRRDEPGEDECS